MALAKNMERIQTIHIGQVVVQQHEVQIGMRLGRGKRLRAGAGLQYTNPFVQAFEHLAQALAYQNMVVNNENFHSDPVMKKPPCGVGEW